MDAPEQKVVGGHSGRRKRAWWQWAFAFVLFGGAGTVAVYNYVPGIRPERTVRRVKPREIRISPALETAESLPAAPGDLQGSNVLIVTFDTTRADHIGCYGYDRVKTPALDRVAREGVLFSQAISPSPTTLPAHSSLLTGLYPYHHGARANNSFRLGPENLTLAEILADHGYATGAFVSSFVLDSQFGIDQGFQHFDADFEVVSQDDVLAIAKEIAQRPADKTNRVAEAWLRDHADEKFALWVHYYDPHFPYEAPKPFSDDYDLAYDAEIAFTDFHLGRLLAMLDELQVADRTLVVVAGDHGEGLGQHEEWFHSVLVYESTMHVPLVMRCGQKLGQGVHISRPVSLVDVMPTILSLLGIPVPDGLDGVDLTQPAADSRPIYVETLQALVDHGWAALLAVRKDGFKYIYGPESELYDLTGDPFEKDDLLQSEPGAASSMLAQLKAFYGDDLEAATTAKATHQLSSRDLAKLQSLGYMGTMSDSVAAADRPHPRDMMPLLALADQALMLDHEKGVDACIERLEKISKRHPAFATVWQYLGDKYAKRGDLADAEDAYTRCLELRPSDTGPLMALARLSLSQRRLDEAIDLYREVLTRNASHFGALNDLGRALRRRGEFTDAAEVLTMALAVRPDDEALPDLVAETLISIGRPGDAITLLQGHLVAEPNLPAVRNTLAGILVSPPLLKYTEAIALLREGIVLAPEYLQLVNNLAFILAICPDQEIRGPVEAGVMMERVCAETGYLDPRYMHTLAMVYGNLLRFEEAIIMAERARDVALESADGAYADLVPALGISLEQYRALRDSGLSAAKFFYEPGIDEDEVLAVPTSNAGPVEAPQTNGGE